MPITFKAFLSHSYSAAEVNLYFFKLFREVAEVQFEVDKKFEAKTSEAVSAPKKKSSTSVTRLERMLRDSDAFIGLYPFSGVPQGGNLTEELKKQSRYFRLEIDLAIRSQKPAIVFYDKRYGDLLKPPEDIFSFPFDANEISGKGGSPNAGRMKIMFDDFCELVKRRKTYDEFQLSVEGKSKVAVLLSATDSNETLTEKIINKLAEYNCDDVELAKAPLALNNKFFRLLEKLDFAIVDHGGAAGESGIPAFLHGRFIPMIRTEKLLKDATPSKVNSFLFDGYESGYKTDKIVWEDEDYLLNELTERLDTILKKEVERFNTFAEAENYFLRATLREEKVFVSYSGKDLDIGKDIIKSLKGYFKNVFDYRDGKSIEPSKAWIEEIYKKMDECKIGISLYSPSYFASDHCMHEVQQMMAMKDSKALKLYPVKLYADPINPPPFLGSLQYMRVADYPSVDEMVKEIVRLGTQG